MQRDMWWKSWFQWIALVNSFE